MFNLQTVEWAAHECKRQHVGPERVPGMLQAWARAKQVGTSFSWADVAFMGSEVEYRNAKNPNGIRTTPVSFPDGSFGPNAASVPRAIETLFAHGDRTDPDGFVKEFLDIHPFEDGNGRVASILWNVLSGTLEEPRMLPYFYERA